MNISRKFFMISGVALALGIPLFILFLLIGDRHENAATARQEISAGWGGEQSLRGPWLVVPFVERQVQTVQENGLPKQVITEHQDALLIAPDDLGIASRLAPDTRRRGLHEVVVYQAEVALDARFSASALDQADVDPALLDWSRAYYSIAISDPRGFGGDIPRFNIGGRSVEAIPGGRDLKRVGGALSAPAGLVAPPAGPIRLSTRLKLKGSSAFNVAGDARRLTMTIASTWPHPSFVGGLLPDARTISAQGFNARWSTTYLARNQPLVQRASQVLDGPDGRPAAAGVALIEPIDLYAQVERAVKYGLLFIALTFLTFFTYDVTGKRRVPLLAYALVGLGLVLFYLLLLALAEYVGFAPAYVVAAIALIGLTGSYAKAVLGGIGRAAVIGGVLTILYGVLYVLLRLEDYALLLGSLVLFAALAVLMYVTRNVGELAEEDTAHGTTG
jgi:inner membrane protein